MRRIVLLVAPFCLFLDMIGCSPKTEKGEKPGLVGAWYGGADLTRVKVADLITTLAQVWTEQDDRGKTWSARWQGFLVAPASGEITFYAETGQRAILEINEKKLLQMEGKQAKQSASISMIKDRRYPIKVTYIHDGGGYDGYLTVKWSWPGKGKTSIPAGSLCHTAQQLQAISKKIPRPIEEKPGSVPPLTVAGKNVIVYSEPGRFCGWPANNGIWSWGNEILVGFELGYYKASREGHSIDRHKPQKNVLARSLDGGETWKMEDPENFVGDGGKAIPTPGNINFADPDFAMRCNGGQFFISYDRGKTWQGPYQFPDFGTGNLSSRTDYILNGKKDCLLFLSAKEKRVEAGLQDRAFCARTTDGGKTFQFLGWMTQNIKVRSVMPSTVRISDNELVSALRRRHDIHREGLPDIGKNWIDVYRSNDNGKSWKFLSKVADTDTGRRNGNPPSLVRLSDGRVCVTYGYRASPYGIRAKVSRDNGKTWGEEIGLRVDGLTWDLGYTRTVQRPDGKLVTVYYHATAENPQQHVAATIWNPKQVRKNY